MAQYQALQSVAANMASTESSPQAQSPVSGHARSPHSVVQATAKEMEMTKSLVSRIRNGQLMIVDSRRRNGLILYKRYHAEFAGPGAAIGGCIDLDCEDVLPVGNLLLLEPSDHEERQKSYLIRRQWIRLTHQFTDNKVPAKRAQMILNQFETYFDRDTIAQIPDTAFAKLVGVLPHTVKSARRKRFRGKKNKS